MSPTAEGLRGRMLRSLASLLSSAINPALWGTLLQRLYDGAATPIEQTSEITGSPMTVVNDLANTGDRRLLRAGRVHTTDGSADHCTLPSAVLSAISGQGSVTLSIKHISGDSAIELRGAGSRSVILRNGWLGPNTVMYYVHDGVTSAQYDYNKGSSLSGDQITVIHANGTPVLHINGTPVSWTASPAGMPAAFPTSLTSGKIGADGGAFYVAGSYREVGIWSSDLSESDIAALPDTIPTTDCAAWYWCEEEFGSVLFDSVSGNHGTITGTLGDIHQPDTGVTYSAANSLGHTVADGSTMYAEVGLSTLLTAGTIIPRDESNPTKCCAYDSGGQVALQYSGSAPRYAQVIQSGALQGDGAADLVTMPVGVANALKGATNATAVMWFKRPSSNAECFITLGNLNYRFSIMVYTGNVIYAVVEAGGSSSYGSVANADTDSWHCAVLRFRGGETGNANRCQLWIDGVNQTLSFSGTIPAALENSAQLETGRYLLAEWNGNPGNGLQGLSALYSDAWTEQEIADHYSTLAMPTDNAVAIYPCSEVNTAEGTVYDVSGNERHGTISGTVADVRAGRQDVIAWNQLHGFSLDGSTYVPGFNGLQPDGSTPTTYAPGATADKFTPDSSQIDRTGGVSHPDANVNSWDTSFESGDTQSNPEFVRNAAAGDDRFLAYQDTLTGDDLTSAQDYTT